MSFSFTWQQRWMIDHLSPVTMEQDRRLQLIDNAIQKLIQDDHDKNNNKVRESHHNDDDRYQNALSHLLSVSQVSITRFATHAYAKLVSNFILGCGVY